MPPVTSESSGGGRPPQPEERYLSWGHHLALIACVAAGIWAFPTNRELSTLLVGSGQGRQALEDARLQLARLDPAADPLHVARALRRLGLAEGLCGRPKAMLDVLRSATLRAPRWLAGWLALADACRGQALSGEEVRALTRAFELIDGLEGLGLEELRRILTDFELTRSKSPPPWAQASRVVPWELADRRRRLAESLDFAGQPEAAVAQYRRLLDAEPDDLRVASRVAVLLSRWGDDHEGARTLEAGLVALAARTPDAGAVLSAWRNLADTSQVLRAVSANWHLRRRTAASSAPRSLALEGFTEAERAVLEGLRRLLLARAPGASGLTALRRAVALRPTDEEAWLQLARGLTRAGEIDEALERYRELRRLTDSPEAFQNEIEMLLRWSGDADGLIAELRLRYGRSPALAAGFELASQLRWTGRLPEALALLRELAARHPDDRPTAAALAETLQESGLHDEAVALLERLLGRDRAGLESVDTRRAAPLLSLPTGRSGKNPLPLGTAAGASPGFLRIGPPQGRTGKNPLTLAGASPIRRRLLALYKGSEENLAENCRLHELLEIVCDHLGLLLEYRDVEQGLPDPAEMSGFAGVVTWFEQPAMRRAREFLAWTERQFDAGRPVLFFGGLGARIDVATGRPVPEALLNRVLGRLGVAATPMPPPREVPRPFRVIAIDPAIEFERCLGKELPGFDPVVSTSPRNRIFLSVEFRRDKASRRADMAVLSPHGLYVSPGLAAYTDPMSLRRQLRIDPFSVLAALFDAVHGPVPDATTVNGVRTAVIHVDGDGAANPTGVRSYATCLDALMGRIFTKFRLESTVSFIASEIDPERPGTAALARRARELFLLPWIEPASHGYTHPFDWRNPQAGQMVAHHHSTEHGAEGFELDEEVRVGGELIQQLGGRRPPAPVFLWTGACNPDEEQLAFVRKLGVFAMNGGDGRFDESFPSVTALSPWTRPVGRERQLLSPLANEFFLSETGELSGASFARLEQSWDRTGSPRRLKPMGLYFHHYQAQSEEGLATLEGLHERLVAAGAAVVPASEFIQQVQGARAMEVERLGPGAFRFRGGGRCLTVRASRELGTPDVDASQGVAGYVASGPDWYIHLTPRESQELKLTGQPAIPRVMLEETNLRLRSWRRDADRLRCELEGFGAARVVLSGSWIDALARCSVAGPSGDELAIRRTQQGQGRWRLEFAAPGLATLEVVAAAR